MYHSSDKIELAFFAVVWIVVESDSTLNGKTIRNNFIALLKKRCHVDFRLDTTGMFYVLVHKFMAAIMHCVQATPPYSPQTRN